MRPRLLLSLLALGALSLPALISANTPSNYAASALAAEAPPSNTWAHTFGDGEGETAGAVAATADGGWIIAGYTATTSAIWAVKLDAAGSLLWQKTFKLSYLDQANAVAVSLDGGYVISGDASGTWTVLKLSPSGDLLWDKTYGSGYLDHAQAILATPDGGYLVAGNAYDDGWLLKLNADGNVLWSKTYDDGTTWEPFYSVALASDGGAVLAGKTGDPSYDAWVIKVDGAGNVMWSRALGSWRGEEGHSVVVAPDGGYVVAGWITEGGDKQDVWAAKLDASGNLVWSKTYGGSRADSGSEIAATADGGYFLSGQTVSFGGGSYDKWLLKLDASGNLVWSKTYGGRDSNTGPGLALAPDGGAVIVGLDQQPSFHVEVVKVDRLGNLGFPGATCNFVHPAAPTVKDTGGGPRDLAVTVRDYPVTVVEQQPVIDQVQVTTTSYCEAPGGPKPTPTP